MKVVLRHQVSGRYYSALGQWVRRSDNALAFDDVLSAETFSRRRRLAATCAVHRLAPYLLPLLRDRERTARVVWPELPSARWHLDQAERLSAN
jgi:hypothetical protein